MNIAVIGLVFILKLRLYHALNPSEEAAIRKYYSQDVLSSFEFDLTVTATKSGSLDRTKLQSELCSHFLAGILKAWQLDLHLDAVCEVKTQGLFIRRADVFVRFIVPQYLLFINDIYNNDEDFEETMKDLWTTQATAHEKWTIAVDGIYTNFGKLRVGRVTSVGAFKGMSECTVYSKLCEVSRTTPQLRSAYGALVCESIRRLFEHKKQSLAKVLEGCWVRVDHHDGKKIYSTIHMFFSWDAVKRRLQYTEVGPFLIYVKNSFDEVQKPLKNKFFKVEKQLSEYLHDEIFIPFRGNLGSKTGYVQWDSKYRLTNTKLYQNVITNGLEELKDRITEGDKKISRLLSSLKIKQIRQSADGRVHLGAYMVLSEAVREDLGIPRQELTARIEAALEDGKLVRTPIIIRDIILGEFSDPTEHMLRLLLSL